MSIIKGLLAAHREEVEAPIRAQRIKESARRQAALKESSIRIARERERIKAKLAPFYAKISETANEIVDLFFKTIRDTGKTKLYIKTPIERNSSSQIGESTGIADLEDVLLSQTDFSVFPQFSKMSSDGRRVSDIYDLYSKYFLDLKKEIDIAFANCLDEDDPDVLVRLGYVITKEEHDRHRKDSIFPREVGTYTCPPQSILIFAIEAEV